ncbi:MAG: IS4 family transposase, partial [Actinomycetota bacterium]|nr:IS4 family transposase [Actinomycetota bacterium]
GNTACQHTVHFGGWNFTDSAYCAARKRLPLGVLHRLMARVADTFRGSTEASSTWLGHRVWLLDGSSFSMSDTPALQAKFGQPGGQRRGCGFPVAKFLALFDLATGMLLRVEEAPLRSHEMSRCAVATAGLSPGDVVLGDRAFCSFAHIGILHKRGLHGVFRAHQRQIIDFTPARPHAAQGRPKGQAKGPTCLPHSRWVRAQGDADQVVIWSKPKGKPTWMSKEEYADLPAEVTVRELRYKVHTRGFRVGEVTLVTTLLDAAAYPAAALADLYYRRWQVELNFRHLKMSMKMDVLKCKTVAGVLKELAVFALVYNLVRSVMCESAKVQGVASERVSLLDALRWLVGAEGDEDLSVLLVNPARPGRVEPRVVKRRPKQYPRMTKPRSVLRKELLEKEDAA